VLDIPKSLIFSQPQHGNIRALSGQASPSAIEPNKYIACAVG
jgi:hypothetical protein